MKLKITRDNKISRRNDAHDPETEKEIKELQKILFNDQKEVKKSIDKAISFLEAIIDHTDDQIPAWDELSQLTGEQHDTKMIDTCNDRIKVIDSMIKQLKTLK